MGRSVGRSAGSTAGRPAGKYASERGRTLRTNRPYPTMRWAGHWQDRYATRRERGRPVTAADVFFDITPITFTRADQSWRDQPRDHTVIDGHILSSSNRQSNWDIFVF